MAEATTKVTTTSEDGSKSPEQTQQITGVKRKYVKRSKQEGANEYTSTVTPTVRAMAVDLRTYHRVKDGIIETWEDVCDRVRSHIVHQYLKCLGPSARLTQTQTAEIDELMNLIYNRKVAPAGRTLFLGGTELVTKKNRESTQFNCSFLELNSPNTFRELAHLLMQGCGVGFENIENTMTGFKHKIDSIEMIRSTRTDRGNEKTSEKFEFSTNVWKIELGDSADGWCIALEKLLECNFPVGFRCKKLVLDFSQIRPAGIRLKDYGWVSLGDAKVSSVFSKIAELLNNKAERYLSEIDMLDIANHIGTMLSTRRSAQIALKKYGTAGWKDFATAKREFWLKGNHHRQQSNNSLMFHSKPSRKELQEIFDIIVENGGSEPGFINMEEAIRRAPWCRGVNPCGEILLPVKGFCCLVEVNLRAFKNDYSGLMNAINIASRLCYRQTVVNLNDGTLDPQWQQNMNYLHLCGVGVTGITTWDSLTEFEWQQLRNQAKNGAMQMANECGLPSPKNVTCVKPSGCLAPETLLQTNFGLKRLDEIGNINGSKWQDLSEKGLLVAQEQTWQAVSKFYVNDFNIVKKLKFASGLSLTCTPQHQMRILRDGEYVWSRADALVVGDRLPFMLDTYAPPSSADIFLAASSLGCKELLVDENDTDETIIYKKANLAAIFNSMLMNLIAAYRFRRAYKKVDFYEFHIYSTWNSDEVELCRALLFKYFANTSCVQDITNENPKDAETGEPLPVKRIVKFVGKGIFDFLENTLLNIESTYKKNPPFIVDAIRNSSRNDVVSYIYGSQGLGFLKGVVRDNYIFELDTTLVIHTTKQHWADELLVLLRAMGYNYKTVADENLIHFNLEAVEFIAPSDGDKTLLTSVFGEGTLVGIDSITEIKDDECETFDIEVPENHCYVANSMISHNTLSKHFATEETGHIPEGIHKPLGQYIFNNILYSKTDPAVKVFREANYRVFDKPSDGSESDSVLVTFPVRYDDSIGFEKVLVTRKDGKQEIVDINAESAIDQLERYRKINTCWSDQNTSTTISYDIAEIPAIIDWFMTHWDNYVGVSFIYRNDPSKNAADLGYLYLPQEVVSKSDYDAYVSQLLPIDFNKLCSEINAANNADDTNPIEEDCPGGACPVR